MLDHAPEGEIDARGARARAEGAAQGRPRVWQTDTSGPKERPMTGRSGRWYLIDFAGGRPTNPARIPVARKGAWYYEKESWMTAHLAGLDLPMSRP